LNQDGNKKTTEVDSLPVRAFKPRAAIHWARRIWHVSGVVVVALIFHEVSYSVAISLLATAVLFIAVPDILRLKIPALNRFVLKWFRMILRESEVNQISGVTYILLGMFIIAALFPKQVVELSLLLLAFGDPAATIFGVRFGKDKIWGNKSLQGASAAFLICTVVAYIYFLYNGLMLDRAILVAIITGLIGAASEIIPIGKWDDNFSFPILSSTMLYILFITFGGFA